MPPRIVTYAHRYKRPPRKKPGKAAAITGSAIVKAPTKLERIRRREAADAYARRTRFASRSAGCRRCRNAYIRLCAYTGLRITVSAAQGKLRGSGQP